MRSAGPHGRKTQTFPGTRATPFKVEAVASVPAGTDTRRGIGRAALRFRRLLTIFASGRRLPRRRVAVSIAPAMADVGPVRRFFRQLDRNRNPAARKAARPSASAATPNIARAAAPNMTSSCNCAAPATATISILAASSLPTRRTRSADAGPSARRNVGGTAIGDAQGERLHIHAESSAFSADLVHGDTQPAAKREHRFTRRRTDRKGVDHPQPQLSGPPRWIGYHGDPRPLRPDRRLYAGLPARRLRLCLLDQDARRLRRARALRNPLRSSRFRDWCRGRASCSTAFAPAP